MCRQRGRVQGQRVASRVYIPPFPRTCCPMLSIEDITNAPAVRDDTALDLSQIGQVCVFSIDPANSHDPGEQFGKRTDTPGIQLGVQKRPS